MTIKELITEYEINSSFKVMKQLRTHLDLQSYINLVKEAQEHEGYKLFALYKDNDIAAVIGFMPMITLYNGKFIWVCDLVTDQSLRSHGFGEQLLNYAHQWAKDNGYTNISLSSGLQREDAHRFYTERMGYDKVSYVFKKELV